MKTKNVLFILFIMFLFSHISMQAQDSTHRSSFSFLVGPSYPYGKFQMTDITNNESGYAKTGMNLLFCYDFQYNSRWGLNVNFLNYINPINIGKIENYYNSQSVYGERYTIEDNDSSWSMVALTIGVTFQKILDKKNKWFFRSKLAMGPGTGYSPAFTVVRTEPNGNEQRGRMVSSSGEVFFLNLGIYTSVELGYFISRRFYTHFYACHLLKSEGLQDPFLNDGYSFNFSTYNWGIGLAYRFGS